MANINNNKRTILDLKLKNDEYWDFMLSKDLLHPVSFNEIELEGLASFIDFNDSRCVLENGEIESLSTWKYAVNEGVKLENIGFTGIDNGLIKYKKDRISNEDFLNIYLNSKYEIPSDRKALFLTPISGNTQEYVYPLPEWQEKEGYTKFSGGFYQGFFKLFGHEYQTLPHYLGNEWNININLRPKDYPILDKSLNYFYPENKGFFFYMGTRAENKFWRFYDKDKSDFKYAMRDSYTGAENIQDLYSESGVIDSYYLMDMACYDCEPADGYFADIYFEDSIADDTFKNYFSDGYFDYNSPEYAIVGDYVQEEISLRDLEFETISGYEFDKKGYFEIETDNKFLLFNRTETGYTVSNWDNTFKYTFSGRTDYVAENYFLLFNQTATGYTVNTIQKYLDEHIKDYNVYKDVRNNALGFKINDDGSISYRYLILDCDAEHSMSVIEETSKPYLVKKDKWNNIHIKIRLLDYDNSECYVSRGKGTIKLYIYVDGYLKLISKELPEFVFKPLDDVTEKQEGVPFNISLGGGSQGLIDMIDIDYYKKFEYILPIEKYFAGTFMGDIEKFKFYDYPFDFYTINKLNIKKER